MKTLSMTAAVLISILAGASARAADNAKWEYAKVRVCQQTPSDGKPWASWYSADKQWQGDIGKPEDFEKLTGKAKESWGATDVLNWAGQQGWELAGMFVNPVGWPVETYVLKRRLP